MKKGLRLTYTFTIEIGGKAYSCERAVVGKRVLRQVIYVSGCGSKVDSASYGKNYHPISTMLSVARLIAHEIIREHGG